MIKSGKELKVFTVQQKDLKTFAREAKRYGVLYSVLREKGNSGPNAVVDVIVRASDAPKISRIVERFKLSTVDKASVVKEVSKEANLEQAKAEKALSLCSTQERETVPVWLKRRSLRSESVWQNIELNASVSHPGGRVLSLESVYLWDVLGT